MELYDDNGVYGVALDWFAPADNPYGSFTWEDMDSEHSTPMTIRATSSRDAVISIVHFRLPREVFPCFRAQPVFPTPLGVLFFFLLFFVLPVVPVKGVSFPLYIKFFQYPKQLFFQFALIPIVFNDKVCISFFLFYRLLFIGYCSLSCF